MRYAVPQSRSNQLWDINSYCITEEVGSSFLLTFSIWGSDDGGGSCILAASQRKTAISLLTDGHSDVVRCFTTTCTWSALIHCNHEHTLAIIWEVYILVMQKVYEAWPQYEEFQVAFSTQVSDFHFITGQSLTHMHAHYYYSNQVLLQWAWLGIQ